MERCTYTTSGTDIKHFTNSKGCDSTATLIVTIKQSSASTTTQSSCDSLRWNGILYTSSGTFVKHFNNARGCDSAATLNLTIKQGSASTTTLTSCDSLRWNGTLYTASGTCIKHFTNAKGCDSTTTLILTIKQSSASATTHSSCDSLRWNGTLYTASGTYIKHLTNAKGCDSAAKLILTIRFSTSSTTYASSCDSLRWNGILYTASGTCTKHFTNAKGCDSTAKLVLTIKYSTSSTTTMSSCDSLRWSGTLYTASGTYIKHFTNAKGCDSAATLILTINSQIQCNGNTIIVDTSVTINFNTNPPTYTGDLNLKQFYTYSRSAATADDWYATFNAGANKILIKNGVTISSSTVTSSGSGGCGGSTGYYAPGLRFIGTCSMQVDSGAKIYVTSTNKNAGDIIIQMRGDITMNGTIKNEVLGSNGLPGAIFVASKFSSLTVGQNGRIYDLGTDAGGNLISLLTCGQTCNPGNIIINGLVKAYALANDDNLDATRPRIKVVSLNGSVTVNANTAEPLIDEFSLNYARWDIYGGLLSWVGANNKPGRVEVQALHDIIVRGHGTDQTGYVRTSFGAIAAIGTGCNEPGGVVDVRSTGGNIYGYDRAFDVSGRNQLYTNYANIKLLADSNIYLSRLGNSSCNPVVDASAPNAGDNGGRNDLRAYNGKIIISSGATVSASVPYGCGSDQGSNYLTSCKGLTNSGTVTPTPSISTSCALTCLTVLYPSCIDLFGGALAKNAYAGNTEEDNSGKLKSSGVISVYPNPANGNCNIFFDNDNEIPVRIILCNYLGQEVWSSTESFLYSKTFKLDLNEYKSGIYTLSFIQEGKKTETKKLIISKK